MENYIKITQIRSSIGRLPKHKLILKALGLRRIRQTVRVKDTLVNQGMINHISYMLKINKR